MKGAWVQIAVLFSALASASILHSSTSAHFDSTPKDITTVAGTTESNHLSVRFRAPCPGCFDGSVEGSDDGLDLTLEIYSAYEECSHVPLLLNGFALLPSSSKTGDIEYGSLYFPVQTADGADARNVRATWESKCLKGEASIISVRFESIDGQDSSAVSGFTFSFKQKGQPSILRLQDKPLAHMSDAACDIWLPEDDEKLLINFMDPNSIASLDVILQIEYQQLGRLKAEMEDLHARIRSTETRIMSLLKQEFKACSSLKCIWDTAVSKAPSVADLIASHFLHHKNRFTGCADGQSSCSTANREKPLVVDLAAEETSEKQFDEIGGDDIIATAYTPARPTTATARSLMPLPTATFPPPTPEDVEEENVPEDVEYYDLPEGTEHHPDFPFSHDSGPPFRPPHGPPSRYPQHPPGFRGRPYPTGHHERPHYRPGGLTHYEQRRDYQFRLGLTVVILILLVIITALIFRFVRRQTALFRDPRRRAERAARREERRTRRLYHKAACKHAWRTWWQQLFSHDPKDYEEKRAIILEQEGISEDDVLQGQIRTLRNASDIVRDLVLAEEGRVTGEHTFSSTQLDAGVGSSRFSDIAPSYVTPPPQYEEEVEGEIMVVDGFRYTPSNTDDTPASSVIDCSPRLSLETGRSTIFSKDC